MHANTDTQTLFLHPPTPLPLTHWPQYTNYYTTGLLSMTIRSVLHITDHGWKIYKANKILLSCTPLLDLQSQNEPKQNHHNTANSLGFHIKAGSVKDHKLTGILNVGQRLINSPRDAKMGRCVVTVVACQHIVDCFHPHLVNRAVSIQI